MAKGPWPAGTLLAYRVISNNSDFVRNSSLWNKYVLLRVVKVGAFFGAESKSMAVCLYDWTGDSLPDPKIAESLSFTYISTNEPLLRKHVLHSLISNLADTNIPDVKQDELISNLGKQGICTFVLLDWRCSKGIDNNAVFTPLGCGPEFKDHVPAIYDDNTGGITLVHSIPFDAMLVRRFCPKEQ